MSGIEDAKGNLWMVTYNKGVWRYEPEAASEEALSNYLVKDGDKIITLFTIYKDNHGDLWLGTHESGVYKYNPKAADVGAFEKFRP